MFELTSLVLGIVNGAEVIIIVVIIAVLFFGVKKIPELARSLGKASTEYEKSRIEAKKEIDREKLESIADTLGIDYSTKNDEELRTSIETEMDKSKK